VKQAVPDSLWRGHDLGAAALSRVRSSQALSGYAYPVIFTGSGGNLRLLFASGAVATALAVLADICIRLLLLKQANAGNVNTPFYGNLKQVSSDARFETSLQFAVSSLARSVLVGIVSGRESPFRSGIITIAQ
jgi:hypothetical protein